METIFEEIFEIFAEGFLNLYKVFIPDKTSSKGAYHVIKWFLFVIGLVLLAGLVFGVVLVVETAGQSVLGWVLISLALIYIVFAIVVKIVSYLR